MKQALFVLLFFFSFIPAALANYDGKTLETAIYWYGPNNQSEKFVEGEPNRFFDPTKKTIIYIHGWQKDTTVSLYRETFSPALNSGTNGFNVNSADYWVNAGWNVGIFYWNQLSDEFDVRNAEAKIWTATGDKGMRWRKSDGTYESKETPRVSAAQLFVNEYKKALASFSGQEIRLAGHSLGNQMVTNASMMIYQQLPEQLHPKRVALLDPYWSRGAKDFLGGRWIGHVCNDYVDYLKTKGIVFEQYKSSNLNDLLLGDRNLFMKAKTAYVDLYPSYISLTDQAGKHGFARDWYFYSLAFTLNGQSAATPTETIRDYMNRNVYFYQLGGTNTATAEDDTFAEWAK